MLTSSLSLSVADAISSTNPRVIDDARARKLSNDLKRCTYYETCATYGLNVERVFQDGKCLGLCDTRLPPYSVWASVLEHTAASSSTFRPVLRGGGGTVERSSMAPVCHCATQSSVNATVFRFMAVTAPSQPGSVFRMKSLNI